MKPRNKREVKICELQKQLKPLSNEHIDYAFKNCFENYALQTDKFIRCLECNVKFTEYENKKCPSCKSKFKLLTDMGNDIISQGYLMIMETVEDYQVLRYLCAGKTQTRTKKPVLFCSEVGQKWFDSHGKETTFSRNRSTNYTARWDFNFYSELSIKSVFDDRYTIYPDKVYPKKKITNKVKRNGFKSVFHLIRPDALINGILTDTRLETLLKLKQYKLLKFAIREPKVLQYWKSILISIKENYKIENFSDWKDYLELLEYFGKDLTSAHYVCPLDLKKAHDKLVYKKGEIRRKENLLKRKTQIEEEQKEYELLRNKFFGLTFNSFELTIRFIQDLKELSEIGDKLHHCIFENEYHKKENSLLFTAEVNGEVIETVEFSLKEKEVVQSRGLQNKASEYNPKIIELVNKNKDVIFQRMAS